MKKEQSAPEKHKHNKPMNLRETAYHEAGHYIVADNYKLSPFAMVKAVKENASPDDDDGWKGANLRELSDNRFQNAVVGWAGPIAQYISALDEGGWNGHNAGLDFDGIYKDFFELVGDDESDMQSVCQLPPEQRRGAMDVAWSILKRKRKELRKVAEHLIESKGGTGNIEMFLRNYSVSDEGIRETLAGQPEPVVEHFLKLNKENRQKAKTEPEKPEVLPVRREAVPIK